MSRIEPISLNPNASEAVRLSCGFLGLPGGSSLRTNAEAFKYAGMNHNNASVVMIGDDNTLLYPLGRANVHAMGLFSCTEMWAFPSTLGDFFEAINEINGFPEEEFKVDGDPIDYGPLMDTLWKHCTQTAYALIDYADELVFLRRIGARGTTFSLFSSVAQVPVETWALANGLEVRRLRKEYLQVANGLIDFVRKEQKVAQTKKANPVEVPA